MPGQNAGQLLVSTRFCCKYHVKEIIFRQFREPAHEAWRTLAVAENPVPGSEETAAMIKPAGEHLIKKGYTEYLPDHYAQPGYVSVAETAVSGSEDLLSLGAGTRSRTDGVVYQTTGTFEQYINHAADPAKIYTVLKRN